MYYHDDDPERTWITLNVDSYTYKFKPKNSVGTIRNHLIYLGKQAIKTITPDYLIEAIERGQTFNAGVLEGGQSKTNWKRQSLICLDIDNGTKKEPLPPDKHLTPDEAVTLLHTYGIDPYFMYYSFSSTPEHPKYRLVCVLDKPMTDPDEAEKLTKRLIDLVNREWEKCADTSCYSLDQLFFGSTPNSVFNISRSITTLDTFRQLPPANDEVKEQAPEPEARATTPSPKGRKKKSIDFKTQPNLDGLKANDEEWVRSHLTPAPKASSNKINFYACICGSSDALEVTPTGGGRIEFHCFSNKHRGTEKGDGVQLRYIFEHGNGSILEDKSPEYYNYAKLCCEREGVPLIKEVEQDFKTAVSDEDIQAYIQDPKTKYPIYSSGYNCTKEGLIKALDYNYQVYLITEHLIDNCYFDEFSQSFMHDKSYINDDYFRFLYGDAVKQHFFNGNVNERQFTAQCEYLIKKYHTVNAARDFFDGLKWDGRQRLDRLLIDLYGAEDNALTREALKMWMTAAVKRVYSDEPVQFDYILMLEGKTGTYKTSFFEALGMHGTEGRHFCNALEKQYINNPRSFALNMVGKLICYDNDLKVLKDIKNTDIKGFITRTADTFDNKYDKRQTTLNRQFVIAADTNESAFLTDITGNRRYIVIHIGKGCSWFHGSNWRKVVTDDGLTLEELIYQMWAEAAAAYKSNHDVRLDLSPEAKALQTATNERYTDEGIEAFYIDICTKAAEIYNNNGNVKITDIQKAVGGFDGILAHFTGKEQITIIKACLAKANYRYQSKRVKGKPVKVYAPEGCPEHIDPPEPDYNKNQKDEQQKEPDTKEPEQIPMTEPDDNNDESWLD